MWKFSVFEGEIFTYLKSHVFVMVDPDQNSNNWANNVDPDQDRNNWANNVEPANNVDRDQDSNNWENNVDRDQKLMNAAHNQCLHRFWFIHQL